MSGILFVHARDGARSTRYVAQRLFDSLLDFGVPMADEHESCPDIAIQYPLFGWINPEHQAAIAAAKVRIIMARIESLGIASWVVDKLNSFDQVWLPSTWSIRAALASGVDPRKIRWVPYGVDVVPPGLERPVPGVAELEAGSPVRLLFNFQNGHLRRKGVLDLLDALLWLNSGRGASPESIRILILTDGREQFLAEASKRELPPDLFEFVEVNEPHTPLTDAQLAWLYRNVDAFIAPVRGGAFELMPLEAIAHGCPTIVSAAGGALDYATARNALVVDGIVTRLYDPENRWARNMGEIGSGLVPDKYALAEAIERTRNLRRAGLVEALPGLGEATAQRWTWQEAAERAAEALATRTGVLLAAEELRAESAELSDVDLANAAAAEVDAAEAVSPRLIVVHSPYQRCGIAEYGMELDTELIPLVDRRLWPVEHLHGWKDAINRYGAIPPRGSVVLVHYEPSLVDDHALRQLAHARRQGVHVILVCHHFDPRRWPVYAEAADIVVAHREYPELALPPGSGLVHIPLGCPEFAMWGTDGDEVPKASQAAVRCRLGLPVDKTILTTVGLLSPWKRTIEVVEALLPRIDNTMFLQLICPMPWQPTALAEREAAKLRAMAEAHPDKLLFLGDFREGAEVLDRVYASDLGFLYHDRDTMSASAAAKQFVATRTPLVTTDSTHTSDLRAGVVRTSKKIDEFAGRVVALARDEAWRQDLGGLLAAEYKRLRMRRIAEQYAVLVHELMEQNR